MIRHVVLGGSLIGLCAALAPGAHAATIHVNGTTGDDAWNGLCESWNGDTCGPKATIQAGIDAANPGDEMVIADGMYTGAGNMNLDFGGKAITVRSASGDPGLCVIYCQHISRGFYFHSGEGLDSIVEGLTIKNGSISYGGGVYCKGSSPKLANCRITANKSPWTYGGGVYCSDNSNPMLTNCTISGNFAKLGGGGVYCDGSSSPTLTNCTIHGNTTRGLGAGVCCFANSSPTLTNCILWGDAPQEIHVDSGSPIVTYCDIQGGWPGEGNIDADPLFVDPDGPDDDPDTWEDNDYRLRPSSPCIDAGDNTAVPPDTLDLDGDGDTAEPLPFDLDANPRFLDAPAATDSGHGTPPVVDMGAYELGMGDFDGDGTLDRDDGCPDDPDKTEPGACGCGIPEDACDDSQLPIPGCLCPAIASLILMLTLLGLMRIRERVTKKREGTKQGRRAKS